MATQNYEDIISQLSRIWTQVLDEDITLEPSTTASDVEGWNSLTHVQLMVETEKAFGVSFTASEINSFKNVDELVQALKGKTKSP